MHIAINAHLIGTASGYRKAGISRYIADLCPVLWSAPDVDRWTVYAPPGLDPDSLNPPPHVRIVRSNLPTSNPFARIAWEQFIAPGMLQKDKPDVLFCPLNVMPLFSPCPVVLTLHDLAFMRLKTHLWTRRSYLTAMTRLSVKRADQLIAISDFTRSEALELLDVDPQIITTIPNGCDGSFSPPDPIAVERLRAAKGLPEKYLLYVGTLEPRKNLVGLIRAYAAVREKLGMPLVVVGARGWKFSPIFQVVCELKLEDHVRFEGFVKADELPLYYAAAEAVVYPSLYEGFGLPPLEAMMVGTPVITSNISSMPEVVGDAALLIDPYNLAELGRAMVRVTSDSALRAQLRTAGFERARQFTWEQTGTAVLEVLRSTVQRKTSNEVCRAISPRSINGHSHNSVPAPTVLYLDHVGVLGGAELNLIDMVQAGGSRNHVVLMSEGPLRPALEATGVGLTIFPASSSFSDFRRAGSLVDAIRAIPQVFSLARRVSTLAAGYDLIWANSQKSFVVGCFAAAFAKRPLVWHMRDILAPEHFSFLTRKIAVALANLFASKVITVSDAGLQSFLDSGGRPGLAAVVYNGIDPEEFADIDGSHYRAELCREFPIGDAPLVGLFGRLAPWKGQHVLIEALRSLPGVHAVVVGTALFSENDYAESLRTLARDLGVADRVHFAGFRREIPQWMSAVDLVVHTSIAPEPFGRVIVEAMLSHKPIIATNAGGATEIITDGEDGLLVPLSDPVRLACAIRNLIANPANARSIANRGYDTAIERFGLKSFLANIEQVKAEVVQMHGRNSPSTSVELDPTSAPPPNSPALLLSHPDAG